jgi:hypothetical protein
MGRVEGPRENAAAYVSVRLHDLEFLVGEPAGLGEDVVGDADLADVVQRCGLYERFDEFVGDKVGIGAGTLQLDSQDAGELADPLQVERVPRRGIRRGGPRYSAEY